MESKTFSIPNISCGHCVMTIKRELSEMKGVTSVDGDAAGKTVTVAWDAPASEDGIKALLAEINYPAA
jgi:copper chaperone